MGTVQGPNLAGKKVLDAGESCWEESDLKTSDLQEIIHLQSVPTPKPIPYEQSPSRAPVLGSMLKHPALVDNCVSLGQCPRCGQRGTCANWQLKSSKDKVTGTVAN